MIAAKLRELFETLFPYRAVLQMRRSLEAERADRRAGEEKHREGLTIITTAYRDRVDDLKRQWQHEREIAEQHFLTLTADIAELKKERDYFRGRAERLELRLLPETRQVERRAPKDSRPVRIGPKSWAEVQKEHAAKLKEQEEADTKKKTQKESRIDAPKPLEPESTANQTGPSATPIDARASAAGRKESA